MGIRRPVLRALVLASGLSFLLGAIAASSILPGPGAAKAQGPEDDIDEEDLSADVDNPLFPLPPMALLVYEGEKEDEGDVIDTRVEARVLPETEEVADVEVRAVLVEEYEDGELVERTLDFYAQDRDGTVLYMGELVDEIEDGEVVGHGGQWLAGEGDNLPGTFMPADPQVGDVFEQERAPGIAEDRSEVVATGIRVRVPAGTFRGCIKTRDFDPIGGGTESKYYCPGVGLVREEAEDEHLDLVSVGTFDPDDLDEDVIEAIGGRDPCSDEEDDRDDDAENHLSSTDESESLSRADLALKDGPAASRPGHRLHLKAGLRLD